MQIIDTVAALTDLRRVWQSLDWALGATPYPGTVPFAIFSWEHTAALLTILGIILLSCAFLRRAGKKWHSAFSILLGAVLCAEEFFDIWWHLHIGDYSIAAHLPLQLCSVALIMCLLLLVTGNYRLYEILYFWTAVPVMLAMFFPNIGNLNYPHSRYFRHFVMHGGIALTVAYYTFCRGYRPQLRSVLVAFIAINILALIDGVADVLLGGNYLFLRQRPPDPSPMDYFGSWPWYLVVSEIVLIAGFAMTYLPYGYLDRLRVRDS